jgi:hypothetical protein
LNFYKDSELLQTFVIYNKKKLNISLNISKNIRYTDETTDGLIVGINNIVLYRNTNSDLKQKIEDDVITEGRPSEQHALEGHPYHSKPDHELNYIIKL